MLHGINHACLEGRPLLHLCFALRVRAGLKALAPRVLKVWVSWVSAVVEPRTTVTAATKSSGLLHVATCVAYGTDRRRHVCLCCVRVVINEKTQKRKTP